MTRTLFQCEKCGQEWDVTAKDCPQIVNISCRVNYGSPHHSYDNSYSQDTLSMVWCRDCVDKLGLHKPREKQSAEEVKQAPAPTTEEMLVSLLETIGFTREH